MVCKTSYWDEQCCHSGLQSAAMLPVCRPQLLRFGESSVGHTVMSGASTTSVDKEMDVKLYMFDSHLILYRSHLGQCYPLILKTSLQRMYNRPFMCPDESLLFNTSLGLERADNPLSWKLLQAQHSQP